MVDFWRIGEKSEAESCDGVADADAEGQVAHVDGAVRWVVKHSVGKE